MVAANKEPKTTGTLKPAPTITRGVYAGATAEMVEALRADYLEEIGERLNDLEQKINDCLAEEELDAGKMTDELRQFAFEVRGQSYNLEIPLINTVAHRMVDYMEQSKVLTRKGLNDAQTYLDVISEIVAGRFQDEKEAGVIARRLPAKPIVDSEIGEIEVRDVEVMLVMLHGLATRIVQKELQACGYRVSIVTSVYDALPLIVRTKPDLVIVSAVMQTLSGIDFVTALSTMTETRNTSTGLITSFDRDHDSLQYVPDKVPIIRKGPSFSDDIVEALMFHFLL